MYSKLVHVHTSITVDTHSIPEAAQRELCARLILSARIALPIAIVVFAQKHINKEAQKEDSWVFSFSWLVVIYVKQKNYIEKNL